MLLGIEQPPRGRVILSYARKGRLASAYVLEGSWGATVDSWFSDSVATLLSAMKAQLKDTKGEVAFANIKEEVESLRRSIPPENISSQFLAFGDLYTRFSRWENADGAYREALLGLDEGIFRAMAVSSLASVYRSRNMIGEAMALSNQAIEQYRAVGAYVLLARELQRLSKLDVATNAYPQAIAALDEAVDVLEKSCPGSLAQAAVLNSRGVLRRDLRDFSGARSDHEVALEISRRIAPCGDHEASALLSLGNIWYIQGDLGQAEKLYREALTIREIISPGDLSMANVLAALANIYDRRGEGEEALLLSEHAFRIRLALAPNSLAVADSLNSIGLVYKDSGNFWAAESFLEESLRIRSALDPDSLAEAEALSNLGLIALEREEFERAISLLSKALKLLQPLPQGKSFLAGVLVNLGDVYFHQGDLATAEGYFAESLDMLKKMSASDSELGVVLLNLGNISYARADYELAGERYREAARLFLGLGKKTREASVCLANLASVAQRMHRLEEAAALYKESLAIEEVLAPHGPDISRILSNMGLISLEEGGLLEAEKLISRARLIEKENGQALGVARALTNLGEIAMEGRHYSKALEHYKESLRLLNENGRELHERAEVLFDLGWLYKETGDFGRAKAYLLEAESASKEWAQDTWFEAEIDHALGSIAEKQGKPDIAQKLFGKAVWALERQVAKSDPQPSDRLWFREKYRSFYGALIASLISTGNLRDSFAVSERGRGRSFLDALAMRRLEVEGLVSPGPGQSDLGAIEAKKMQITESLSEASEHAEPEERRRRVEELLRLRQEYGDILKNSPDVAVAQDPKSPDVDAAIASLDPTTVLLSYWVSDERTFLFVLTRNDALRVHVVRVDQNYLREQIGRFRSLINAVDSGPVVGVLRNQEIMRRGRELYQLLVFPAEDQIEAAERVLILPDGPLHYLPFGALVREVSGGGGHLRDQYLAEWKPFHSMLSATLYAEVKKGRRPAVESGGPGVLNLVAFGDPQFPAGMNEKEPDSVSDLRVRSAVRRGMVSFEPLPFSRREVEGIAALFPPEKVKVFVGAEATEERAKAVGKGARILHFATHARLDDRLPLDSALILTMLQGLPSDRDNGLLQVWEIFEKVRLDADLVVLSACDTGLGEEQGGEGLIGLTRAFQYAGARTVMASLWSVQDQATSELMIRFYKHLRAGLSKDEALRQAQIELIHGPIEVVDEKGEKTLLDASAPYFWAGFQLYGDWQ